MTLCFKKVHKHCIEVQYCNFVAKVLLKMLCDCLLIQTLHVLATFDFFFSDFGNSGGSGGGRRRCTERDTEYFGTNLSIRNNGPRNKVDPIDTLGQMLIHYPLYLLSFFLSRNSFKISVCYVLSSFVLGEFEGSKQ